MSSTEVQAVSPSQPKVKVVFGTAGPLWTDDATGSQVLDVLRAAGVTHLDSGRAYGDSEAAIGRRGVAAAGSGFVVDTKHPGGLFPGTGTKEGVLEQAKTSFDLLKTDQVDVYYLHAPDSTVPLEDTLAGIHELYKQGRFRRFGLSNFQAAEVAEVFRLARAHGYVLPSVYEGNYSAVGRVMEEELLPLLRREGVAFYAYSPLAGGFLTRTRAQIEAGDGGRWVRGTFFGDMYQSLYNRPGLLDALDAWNEVSLAVGLPRAELANRWAAYHSALRGEHGDGLIIGASSLEQLRATLTGLDKGPLPADVVAKIDAVWEIAKRDAFLDNYHGYIKGRR
ncbi:hypothetical protein HK405_000797 [Cladochytrium tenue]|nr:hypothetical protein HK405_000797 [Cladochytrium tenue]